MFIKNPNLPSKKVKSVLMDYRAEKTKSYLEAMGIKVYQTPRADIAYNAVSGHPDMAFHLLDEHTAVVSPEVYEYYCGIFGKEHIIKGCSKVGTAYPEDIAYNIARVGRVAFHNSKFTDKTIYEYYKQKGIKLIDVKQGYAKCSICIVSENAVITEDKAIARVAKENGIDSLRINAGGVKLKDFPYGFIGGASGLISEKEIFFNGDITKHSDCGKIFEFCRKYNVKVKYFTDEILEDIGTIIPIE